MLQGLPNALSGGGERVEREIASNSAAAKAVDLDEGVTGKQWRQIVDALAFTSISSAVHRALSYERHKDAKLFPSDIWLAPFAGRDAVEQLYHLSGLRRP